ncbi:RNA-binding component of cleavage and polyadenylation factor [Elasticomyces elasticus]|nr:RNA-binding component of cleavage and polyadenylation factor [Elasticomyces elasticus]KAK3657101.1 RNA-binding component of cleavage and polyadenylation factor [Elasticomyces elasticus]KAK4926670.1 RNA-binding component of cleavage and polyadenylation factor [Elasticomyces elasticus]KAK5762379.1 RNA-binding component of cleavage and polyadenylation factor [Elasticomyces elasticus]
MALPTLTPQILNPRLTPTPQFTFTPYLAHQLPLLGRPSKVARQICPDFRSSHGCPRGPNCEDRHYVPPNERSGISNLICKHYQRGLCKKGDLCEFAHTFNLRDERECKEFSRYGICPQGDDCTYLHIPPTSRLRDSTCPHYTRGFCPLGPYCEQRHLKHKVICEFYRAGFCPNGRERGAPGRDGVVGCSRGSHPRWGREEDLHPRLPAVRKAKDETEEEKEREGREEEYYAEMERQREREAKGESGLGRWGKGMRRGGVRRGKRF